MNTYEYQIQTIAFDAEIDLAQDESVLNSYGKEGWELVTVLGPANTRDHGEALIYFLRRTSSHQG
jgi:hypothetical protein